MKQKLAYYFSPTGGTQKVAEAIGKYAECPPVDIIVDAYDAEADADALIYFCVPVYGGRVPKPMQERMTHITGKNTAAVVVAVYGNNEVGDALMEMSDLCEKSGFKVIAGMEMIAQHSLTPKIAAGRPDAGDFSKLEGFVKEVEAKYAKEDFSAPNLPGSHKYRKYVGLPIKPAGSITCVGCGMCYDNCPVGAIPEKHLRRTNALKCISCMHCVHVCTTDSRYIPKVDQLAVYAYLKKKGAVARKEPKLYI